MNKADDHHQKEKQFTFLLQEITSFWNNSCCDTIKKDSPQAIVWNQNMGIRVVMITGEDNERSES